MIKARTSVYLDKDLKEEAKKLFSSYGMNLSEGLNYLLKKTLDKKELDLDVKIEPILPGDPDYEVLQKAREHFKKHPEDYVTLEEINWN
jgi:antitoxin component of RelBE/YafQ-DinJ toxin-antitoxin module